MPIHVVLLLMYVKVGD